MANVPSRMQGNAMENPVVGLKNVAMVVLVAKRLVRLVRENVSFNLIDLYPRNEVQKIFLLPSIKCCFKG